MQTSNRGASTWDDVDNEGVEAAVMGAPDRAQGLINPIFLASSA